MADVEQERDAVLLGSDRIVDRRRTDLEPLERKLETSGRAFVLAHDPAHFERGLLPDMVRRGEALIADVRGRGDALAYPASVADQKEVDLAARAAVVEPSAKRDFFADVPGKLIYIDPSHEPI